MSEAYSVCAQCSEIYGHSLAAEACPHCDGAHDPRTRLSLHTLSDGLSLAAQLLEERGGDDDPD